MKTLITLLALLTLASCNKGQKSKTPEWDYKVVLPKFDLPEISPITSKRNGYKCEIVSPDGHKELFLEVVKKDEQKKLYFMNFKDELKVSSAPAIFDELTLLPFNLEMSDDGSLIGQGSLLLKNPDTLTEDGRKVLLLKGRLMLDVNMEGVLEVARILKGEGNSIESIPYQDFARIENCEDFEASVL